MTSYKIFKESISLKDNTINFDYNTDTGGVTTSFGKTKNFSPYTSQKQILLGNKVFSAYLSKDKNATNKIIKTIKGQTSIKIDKSQYNQFINRTSLYLAKILRKHKIDILVTGESSSKLNNDILTNIRSRMSIEIYPEAISKIAPSRINNIKINKNIKGFSDEIEKNLLASIKLSKKKGIFKAKDYYKPYLKFLSGFFEVLDPSVLTKFTDKRVCILDDVLSTGSSMGEIMRHIEAASPAIVIGITIFKTKS